MFDCKENLREKDMKMKLNFLLDKITRILILVKLQAWKISGNVRCLLVFVIICQVQPVSSARLQLPVDKSPNIQNPSDYKRSLNGTWLFKTDLYNQGEVQGWYQQDIDTCTWDRMAVPSNWDLKNEYADYVGKAWYRTTFKVPAGWKDKSVRLHFESVYNDVQVWVNGKQVGEHHVGFLPFWFDINPYLQEGENTIALQVDNTFKRGAIWNWGGIRRPIWLEVTDKVRLEQQHITAIPDLDKGTAAITVDFEVSNVAQEAQSFGFEIILSKKGEVVWSSPKSAKNETLKVAADTNLQEKVSLQLPKSKVDLWHFNSPNLYTCQLKLYQNGQVIHEMKDRFGVRKIEVDGGTLRLNGEAIRTVGFNLVAEDRVTGNTLPLWRIKEDVDLMKSLGANMARLSHLPLPEAFLDYLDEKGIMIFEEVSLWGKDEMVDPEHPLPKYWLEKMVQVKYNHPSIIGWSIGNEIGYLDKNLKVMKYVAGAIQHAKQLDPNRLAIYVSNSASSQKTDPVQFSDLIMFNKYGNWGKEAEKAHALHPGKPIFMAEYGNNLNSEDPNAADIDAAAMLDQLRGKEYLIGASLWTFNDYRSFWKGKEGWTTPPSQNRAWGIVNTFRQKKQPFYTFKRAYAPVRKFNVRWSGGQQAASVMIEPRNKLDIPAYDLKAYQVAWHTNDQDGKIVAGGIWDLPFMQPGGENWQQPIQWKQLPQKAHSLTVALLDPQQYSVRDTTIFFAPPQPPNIIKVHTSADRARVVFTKVPDATAYKLLYGEGQESEPTINDFIEVDSLQASTSYSFQVIALNNAGESKPSASVKASTDEDELPPVIWNTVATNHSFFIGYSVDPLDYMYEIRYGTSPGDYTQQIGLRNVGVCQVPGLKTGQTYYYQMRNRKQWGFASEWSHEVKVQLSNDKGRQPVALKGHIRKAGKALLVFEPVKKAVGYNINYRAKGQDQWKTHTLSSAVVNYALVEGLEKDETYEFEIKAMMEQNTSPTATDISLNK